MKAAFYIAVIIALYALASHIDYTVAKEIAEVKAAKAKPQSRMEPAPIFSKRCIRRGQTYNARQADGGVWVISCYGPKGTRA